MQINITYKQIALHLAEPSLMLPNNFNDIYL